MAARYSVANGNWNATSTWATSAGGTAGASVPIAGDRAILYNYTVTMTADAIVGSLHYYQGTLEGDGNKLTIKGDSGHGGLLQIDNNVIDDIDITIDSGRDGTIDVLGSSGSVNNLVIDSSGYTISLAAAATISEDLTITAGTLDTDSGSNHALTVTGDVSVTGTLTGNASAISMKSIDIASGGTYTATSGTTTITGVGGSDYPFKNHTSGNFVHSSGTVTFSSSAYKNFDAGGDPFYNFISTGTSEFRSQRAFTVANDFTISSSGSGYFRPNGNAFTVTGDVAINSGGEIRCTDEADTFGSLTIASGGTYSATSGTTTITSMTSTGSGDRSLSLVSGGTFTNNGGTVLFNSSADQRLQMAGTGNLYNLTVNKSDNEFITFGNLTIENNLDVTLAADHTWRPDSTSDTLTVYGNTYLTTGRINNGSTQYAGTNNWGNVTINSGEFVLSSGTNNFTGIRNVGGTVSQS